MKTNLQKQIYLEYIQNSTGLFVSETASVFGVNREDVYAWLSGKTKIPIEKENILDSFIGAIDYFERRGFKKTNHIFKMKNKEGKTILDLIKINENWHSTALELLEELRKMEQQYQKSGISKSKAKPTDDWKSDFL